MEPTYLRLQLANCGINSSNSWPRTHQAYTIPMVEWTAHVVLFKTNVEMFQINNQENRVPRKSSNARSNLLKNNDNDQPSNHRTLHRAMVRAASGAGHVRILTTPRVPPTPPPSTFRPHKAKSKPPQPALVKCQHIMITNKTRMIKTGLCANGWFKMLVTGGGTIMEN